MITTIKTLLILRHAKSSWDDDSLNDHDRPLTKRGKRASHRMGRLLDEENLWPDLILSSTAERAATTTQRVTEAGSFAGEIYYIPELYGAGPHDLIEAVRELGGEADCVMIVAHNPGLEDLVQQMTGEHHRLPTAALVRILVPIEHWRDLEADGGTLAGIWRPKELD
jgi:phosphohistidine phosphatase